MKSIEYSLGNNTVCGYITSVNEENFINYLSEHLEEDVIEQLLLWMKNSKIYNFALLKNLYVEESNRGQGIGSKLLEDFITKSAGSPIILIVDNLESQKNGFVLEDWYFRWDFQKTPFKTLSGPILIRF